MFVNLHSSFSVFLNPLNNSHFVIQRCCWNFKLSFLYFGNFLVNHWIVKTNLVCWNIFIFVRLHHFIHFLSVHWTLSNLFVFFFYVLDCCISKNFQRIFKWRFHAKLLYFVMYIWFCAYKFSSFEIEILLFSKSWNFENRMHLYLFAQLSVKSEVFLIIIDINILMKFVPFIVDIRNNSHHCVFLGELI